MTFDMPIYISNNLVETYRLKTLHGQIHELSGRDDKELTKIISDRIIDIIQPVSGHVIVDIGCGDGTLLSRIAELKNLSAKAVLIGILPNHEEVSKVQIHLSTFKSNLRCKDISIKRGLAQATGLRDHSVDLIICNSVLHGAGQTYSLVRDALDEFSRIAKDGCVLFIGEMPARDELAGRNYGNSVFKWLLWTARHRGMGRLVSDFKSLVKALFFGAPFIIEPKYMFFIEPSKFEVMLSECGFTLQRYFKHEGHLEPRGYFENSDRWNYIALKSC